MSGPPPKREIERRRRNKDVVPVESINIAELIQQEVLIPVPPMRSWEWAPEEDDEGNVIWSKVTLEEPVDAWEPLTLAYWEAFKRSGQSVYYEPSDWMTAYALMEMLDRWLKPQEVKVGQIGSGRDEGAGGDVRYVFEPKIVATPAGVITAILKGMTSLMATEGDRRRLRMELERESLKNQGGEIPAGVGDISKKRAERFSSGA